MAIPQECLHGIRLVVFDLDGTLIDSKEDLALSVNATRQQMGFGPLPYEVITSYVGQGVTRLMRRALGNGASRPVSDETIEQATRIFLRYYGDHKLDHTLPYPGVPETLVELRGHYVAVLTNKPVRFSTAILEGLALADYFDFIYGGDSFARKKPDPIGLLKIMADAGVGKEQTLMVGDSDTDVLTGRNAGVWTCGVTYGFAPKTLEENPPDLMLAGLRELSPLLLSAKEAAT